MISYLTIAYILVLFALWRYYYTTQVLKRKLADIPRFSSDGLFSLLTAPFSSVLNASGMVQQGYNNFRGSLFRIPVLTEWVILITTPTLIEDMQKASDDVISSLEGLKDLVQAEYTLGKSFYEDPYVENVIKGPFTRNISAKFAEVIDEISASFQELFPQEDEWELINLNDALMPLVARTSNRFLSGLPLCRNPDYLDLNIRYTMRVILAASFIGRFPTFLKPLVGKLVSPLSAAVRRAKRHLVPIIQERLANEEHYGEGWAERPNDLLTWLLSKATTDSRRTIDDLVLRFLSANLAALFSTNMIASFAVSSLALHSEYVDELRDEIEDVVSEHGWTKAGMDEMRKLDSFLKESQRCYLSFAYGLERKVLKDFTFSNGVTVPAGATLAVPMWAIHHDNDYFPDADKFDGFRFSRMREDPGQSFKHQMVAPRTDFLLFGTGRQAW
ncbi:hypothetical protein GYMLUDRAFT_689400 [Collybiopsis luxurians FD-317 M1]|uniref:Unplaced genomic scaffold GYMLUscaffold_35, whole genome shotgun sequence n=1 Tax=Collybiopsis luxurians FD-317 M1 TaxID=944289 RepID=A0A0D0C897_9AGAR|nr:hypothetical protein GYMLUDRAFT_689400 [Collybiopsis luxurians FD-317 M1]